MRELDARALGQVGGRAGARDELGQPGYVVGLQMRVEHRDDRGTLGGDERDVLVDELDVRLDDGESAVGLAPQQVRGARGLVVQQLAEVHTRLQKVELTGLTSYQLIY